MQALGSLEDSLHKQLDPCRGGLDCNMSAIHRSCLLQYFNAQSRGYSDIMRFGSTAKVLAECKLKYYRIS